MAKAKVADLFQCSYGDFDFPGESTETLRITTISHYDEAGRTIAYMEYLIALRTVVYAASPNGDIVDTMNDIRQVLMSPGNELVYQDRGFGDFEINTATVKDVKWGPKPKILNWEQWGDNNVAQIEWQVEVCIPECSAAKYENHVMEYNYRLTDDVDTNGFTTRRVAGYLSIPQTRNGQANRQFKHSADEYRAKIKPTTPERFRPLPMSVTLSLDKCRLDFSFADQEMGRDIPPPGILRVKANMTAQNPQAMFFNRFIYTIDATYDLALTADPQIAIAHFLKIVASRRNVILPNANKVNVPGLPPVVLGPGGQLIKPFAPDGKQATVGFIELQWRFTESDIYAQVKQYSASVTFAATFFLWQLLIKDPRNGGFFTPMPDSDWNKWKVSLIKILPFDGNGVRGQAGLKFNPGDDLIIDLCQQDLKDSNLKPVKPKPPPPMPRVVEVGPPPRVVPDWVLYEQSFYFQQVDNPVLHKPLVPPPSPGLAQSNFQPPGQQSQEPGDASIVGTRCQSTWYMVHTGRAIRVGKPINPPVALFIGPLQLIPANRPQDGFKTMIVPGVSANIHVATWSFRYLIPSRVGTDAMPPNPTADPDRAQRDLRDAIRQWDVKFRENQKAIEENLNSGPASGGLPRPF